MKAWILTWIAAGVMGTARGVELPMNLGTFTTLDNKVYENAKVVGSDGVGIKISHEAGSARIPFERLPRDLAAKFKVDPEAAAEQRRQEHEEMMAHEREAEAALRSRKPAPGQAPARGISPEEDDEEELPDLKIEYIQPAGTTPVTERMLYLQKFVQQTTLQIHEIEKDVERRNRRIQAVRAATSRESGGAYRQSKARKLTFMERSVKKQADHRRRLEEMIDLAQEEIRTLSRGR